MRRWVVATKTPQEPLYGSHPVMKRRLAEQACHRCVYCGMTVARNGSDFNFEVEHFRPESAMTAEEREAGEHLNPYNLLYACSYCNRLKGNTWPGEPNVFTAPVHVDPSKFDYHDMMRIDPATWEVEGKCIAGTYIATQFGLNRDQLLQDRRADYVIAHIQKTLELISTKMATGALSGDLLSEAFVLLTELCKVVTLLGSEGLLAEA